MSKQISVIKNSGKKDVDLQLTKFHGDDKKEAKIKADLLKVEINKKKRTAKNNLSRCCWLPAFY